MALEQRRNSAQLRDGFFQQITSVSLKFGGGVWL
jgi:hypothetical protein